MIRVGVWLLVLAVVGCSRRNVIECAGSDLCAQFVGAECRVNPATGNSWCAAPDGSCPSGLRWTEEYTGDELEGQCVGDSADGSPTIDAGQCERLLTWTFESRIWAAAPDGSGQRQLLSTPATTPFWSPRADRLAYSAPNGGSTVIWTLVFGSTTPTPITEGPRDVRPAWSPDGTRIVFERLGTTVRSLWIVDATGGIPVELTTPEGGSNALSYSWSPDGQRIAFSSRRDGNLEIYTIRADGSDEVNITNAPGSGDHEPQWSPDGDYILFVSDRSGRLDYWRMSPDGSNQMNLFTAVGSGVATRDARWFPDGAKIVYSKTTDSPVTGDIHVMNSDGTAQQPIEQIPDLDVLPSVSPDRSQVAWLKIFAADAEVEVFVSDADGSNPVRITNRPGTEGGLSWRPCP